MLRRRKLPEASVLRLQPDDVVVLHTDAALSLEAVRGLQEQASAKFDGHRVVVLTGGLTAGVADRSAVMNHVAAALGITAEDALDLLAERLLPRIRTGLLTTARRSVGVGLS